MDWAEIYMLSNDNFRASYLKLFTFFQNIEVNSIAEIGVYNGRASKIFNTLFPEAHLYLIDPWELTRDYLASGLPPVLNSEKYSLALEEVLEHFKDHRNVSILRKTSKEAAPFVPNELDLIFIDGNHDYTHVKEDILTWLPKLRMGGVLSGHDYEEEKFPGVVQAVNEILGDDIIIGQDNVWTYVKKK